MAEWGRKQYAKPWPSRMHVWTWGAFFLSCLFFVFAVWQDGRVNWTAAERLYLSDYLRSGARGTCRSSTANRAATWCSIPWTRAARSGCPATKRRMRRRR